MEDTGRMKSVLLQGIEEGSVEPVTHTSQHTQVQLLHVALAREEEPRVAVLGGGQLLDAKLGKLEQIDLRTPRVQFLAEADVEIELTHLLAGQVTTFAVHRVQKVQRVVRAQRVAVADDHRLNVTVEEARGHRILVAVYEDQLIDELIRWRAQTVEIVLKLISCHLVVTGDYQHLKVGLRHTTMLVDTLLTVTVARLHYVWGMRGDVACNRTGQHTKVLQFSLLEIFQKLFNHIATGISIVILNGLELLDFGGTIANEFIERSTFSLGMRAS
mmetsp:Transcript_12402/g.37561  ORF Transcript_12402/g.37561 Transcript_12402/m.37561 type:complete len:272 (-) Transcript_12402:238-1053(-)